MSISVLSLASGYPQSCTNSPLELADTEQQQKLALGLIMDRTQVQLI